MVTEIISIIAGIAQIIAAIIIARVQYKQAVSMNKFTLHQDKRDEKRYQQLVHSQALMFLANKKHINDRQFLPLCVIADIYDPECAYRRDIYKDYCCLPNDVKDEVLAINNITLRKDLAQYSNGHQFYKLCLQALLFAYKHYLPNEKDLNSTTMFYDDGKYLYTALHYSEKVVPNYRTDIDRIQKHLNESKISGAFEAQEYMELKEHITNELAYYHDEQPASKLVMCPVWTPENNARVSWNTGDMLLACYEANVVAQYIAIYYANSLKKPHQEEEQNNDIDDYNGEVYFEDLFLKTLFELFNNLLRGHSTQNFRDDRIDEEM